MSLANSKAYCQASPPRNHHELLYSPTSITRAHGDAVTVLVRPPVHAPTPLHHLPGSLRLHLPQQVQHPGLDIG